MAWFLAGLFGGVILGWYCGGVLLLRKRRRDILEEPIQTDIEGYENLAQTMMAPLSVSISGPTAYTIEEAKQWKVCRVCRGPAEPRLVNGALDPFVLNFGIEYAHRSCIGEKHEG